MFLDFIFREENRPPTRKFNNKNLLIDNLVSDTTNFLFLFLFLIHYHEFIGILWYGSLIQLFKQKVILIFDRQKVGRFIISQDYFK